MDIQIGSGLLADQHVIEKKFATAKSIVMIVDEKVDASRLAILKERSNCYLSIPGGEAMKSISMYEALSSRLLQEGVGSDCMIVACGGGATLDLAGFIAATYCRGVGLSLIPSTLLAMTDAAIGGKNGLNLHSIKNCIGTLYHPERVLIDVDFLDSLPTEEMNNGLVEMAKHALLDSKDSCQRFIGAIDKLKAKDKKTLIFEISSSCDIKMRFVTESEKRLERRHLLNFGHTVGHAIESLENFQCSHGQAVAMGIRIESYLAKQLGYLSEREYHYIENLIAALGLSSPLSGSYACEKWLQALQRDKKAALGKARFVLPRQVGQFVNEDGDCVVEVPDAILFEAIETVGW